MGDVSTGGGGSNPLEGFCDENPNSILCPGNGIGWPGSGGGGGGGGDEDCAIEFPDPDLFAADYDATFTNWYWTSPQLHGFEEIVIGPKQVEVDTDIFVQKLYSIDARGRLGHAGRTNGPQGDTSEYDTPVEIRTIEDYAVSAARGLVAQIIADDYPDVIGFTFYALGGTIRQEVGPYDYDDPNQVGDDLGSSQKIQYYSQVKPGSDDTNDGSSRDNDFDANEFSPALAFHQDDAISEVNYPDGSAFSPFERITPTNQSISGTSLLPNGIAANKTHSTPYVAWTPWFENGISETRRWTDAFIAEYQRLQQEVFLENGRVIKNPVRCWLDSELFPKTYNQQHDKTFGLCQLDPRYDTELIPGFNRTLKQIVEGTVDQYLDIDEDTTVFDGAGQKVSLSSWAWEEDENGHNGFAYRYENSELVKGSFAYTLPQKNDASWITVGSGKWWKNQPTSIPSLSGARRYDFLTFNSWYQSLLTTAFDAALEESVYQPLRAAFSTIKCSNYASKDLSLPQPMDANNPVSYLGSARDDVNDNKLYWSREFGGPIISPFMYSVGEDYNPNIEDLYDKRKDYYSNFIDSLLYESTSIEERSLLSSSISPYARDGVGTVEFEKLPENIVPWIQRPTPIDQNIIDSEETVCDFIRMLRDKGIKEVISWNSLAIEPIDDSTSEFDLPGRLGDFDDIYDATARSSITNTNDIKCCRVPSNDSGGWYFQDLGYHFNESGGEITGRAIKNRNDASTYFNTAFPKGGGWSLITMSSGSVPAQVQPLSNNQDSPNVGSGIGSPLPEIDFRNGSTFNRTLIKNLGPIDYEKYIRLVEEEVNNLVTQRISPDHPYRAPGAKTSDTVVLDIEIKLFDVPFVTESGQAYLRNAGSELPATNNGETPFTDAVPLPGIFWDLDPSGEGTRATKTSKWEIMKDCIIRMIQHVKSVVGHDRVTFYDGPFRFFQNDLWSLLDPTKYNGRTLFGEGRPAEAVRLGISDPGIQEIMAENQYHNMAWYTAKFAHKKYLWDELVNAIAEYGDKGVIWTAPVYYLTNPSSGQTDMFSGWSDMPDEYHEIGESTNWQNITEGIDLPTSNALHLHRGIVKYMGDTTRARQVKIFTWLRGSVYDDLGVLAPFDEKINLGAVDGDRIFDEENALILNSTISNSEYLNGYVFGVTRNDYFVYYDYLFNGLFADSLEEPITIPECNVDISYFTTVRANDPAGNNGGVIGNSAPFRQGEIGNVFYLPSYALEADSTITEEEYKNASVSDIQSRINTFLGERDAAGRLLSSYINDQCEGKIVIDVEHPFSYGQIGNFFPDEASLENLKWFTEGYIKRIVAARELFPKAQLGIYGLGTVHPQGSPGEFLPEPKEYRFDPLGGQDIQNLPWLLRHLQAMDYTYDGKTITEVADFILPIHWNVNFSTDSAAYAKLLEGRKTLQAKFLIDEILMKHRENHPNNPLDVVPAVSFVSINPPDGQSSRVDSKQLNKELFRQFAQSSLSRSKYFITEVASFFDPLESAAAPASKAALENECSGSEYYPFVPDHRPLIFNGIWTQQSPKSWTSDDPTVAMAGGVDGARSWGEPNRRKYTRRTDPNQGNGEADYLLTGDVFNANGALTLIEEVFVPLIQQGFSRFQTTNTAGFVNNTGYGRPGDPAFDADADGIIDSNEVQNTNTGVRAFPCNTFTGMSVAWAPNYRANVGTVRDYINTGHCAFNPGPVRGQRSNVAFAHGLIQNTDLSVFGTPATNIKAWLPTPFNPEGEPGIVTEAGVLPNGQGNSPECWKVAIQRAKDVAEESGITDLEFTAYTGWRIPYTSREGFEDARNRQENNELPSEGNYDRVSMGIDFKNQSSDLTNKAGFLQTDVSAGQLFSPDRIPEISFWDYGWWDSELIPIKELGFNGVGFDAGSNVWKEAIEAGLEPDDILEKAKGYGLKTTYEAVPLAFFSGTPGPLGNGTNYQLHGVDQNGNGTPDERYEVTRYWGLFPQFWGCVNDLGGEQIPDFEGNPRTRIGGVRPIELAGNFLDKSKHEIGVVFDFPKMGQKLTSQANLGSQLDLSPDQCKRLLCKAYGLGYMVGMAAAGWSGFGADPEKWGTGQTLEDNINGVREFLLDLTDASRPGHAAAIEFCGTDAEPPDPETGVACIDGQCQVITREQAESLGLEIILDQAFCGGGSQPAVPALQDGQYIPCLTCIDIPPSSCSPCADCSEPNPLVGLGSANFVADVDPVNGEADPPIIAIVTPCTSEEVAPDFPPDPPSGSIARIGELRGGLYFGSSFFATDGNWDGDIIEAFSKHPVACGANLSYVWEKSTDGGANWVEYQVFDLFINGLAQRAAGSSENREVTLTGDIGDQFRLRVNWSSSCPETSPFSETRIVHVADVNNSGGNLGLPYIITIGRDCEDSGGGCTCTTPDIVIQSEVCGAFSGDACFYPVGVQFIFTVPIENRFPLAPPDCIPVLGQATITDEAGNSVDYELGQCFDSSIVGSVLQIGRLTLSVPYSNCEGSGVKTLDFYVGSFGEPGTICLPGTPTGQIDGAFEVLPWLCEDDPTLPGCVACDCYGQSVEGTYGPLSSGGGFVFNIPNDTQHQPLFQTLGLREINTVEFGSNTIKFKFATATNALNFFENWSRTLGTSSQTFPNEWKMEYKFDGSTEMPLDHLITPDQSTDPVSRNQVVYNPIEDPLVVNFVNGNVDSFTNLIEGLPPETIEGTYTIFLP